MLHVVSYATRRPPSRRVENFRRKVRCDTLETSWANAEVEPVAEDFSFEDFWSGAFETILEETTCSSAPLRVKSCVAESRHQANFIETTDYFPPPPSGGVFEWSSASTSSSSNLVKDELQATPTTTSDAIVENSPTRVDAVPEREAGGCSSTSPAISELNTLLCCFPLWDLGDSVLHSCGELVTADADSPLQASRSAERSTMFGSFSVVIDRASQSSSESLAVDLPRFAGGLHDVLSISTRARHHSLTTGLSISVASSIRTPHM